VNFEICVESFEQIFLFLNMTDMYRDYWGDYYTRSQNAFSLSLSLSLWLRRRFIVVVLLYHDINVSGEEAGHRPSERWSVSSLSSL
jgi:hypothetical protein